MMFAPLAAPAVSRRSIGQVATSVLVASVTGALACLTVLQAGLAIPMLAYPGELMYGEAILYTHAHRLLDGAPLYQAIDRLPYAVAGYTPLFYVLAAGSQAFVAPGFAPGRGLALISLVVAGALVGILAGGQGRGLRAAILAALLFLALGAPGSGSLPWTALYKEDSLALALTLGGLALVRSAPSTRVAVVAGVLSALAILTKQTYAPMALAPAIWLWRSDRSRGLMFAGAALLPVFAVAAALQLSTGVFVDNVVFANVNAASGDWLGSNVELLVLFQVGPLLAACAYWANADRRRAPDDGLFAWVGAGAALQLLALAKIGGASNHWMGAAAITAVFAARAACQASEHGTMRGHDWPRWLAIVGLAVGVVLVGPVAASAWLTSWSTSRSWPASGAEFQMLVERVRRAPGEVLADPLDVVVLADRAPLFEPLLLKLFYESGRWAVTPIVQQICDGTVKLIVLDHPIESVDWPLPTRIAVERTMRLEGSSAGRLLYVPNAEPNAAACAS